MENLEVHLSLHHAPVYLVCVHFPRQNSFLLIFPYMSTLSMLNNKCPVVVHMTLLNKLQMI